MTPDTICSTQRTSRRSLRSCPRCDILSRDETRGWKRGGEKRRDSVRRFGQYRACEIRGACPGSHAADASLAAVCLVRLRASQVTIQEREDGQIHCRGLLKHPAATEEDALNLLFLGDTNRNVKATMMNDTSSRSHCIFTVEIEARASGSDTVRRSKLNLVDLAGSERVSKTGAEGQILSEAKYINLSLHYLEQVRAAGGERRMECALGARAVAAWCVTS